MSKSVSITAFLSSKTRYAENKRGFEFGSWTFDLVCSIPATFNEISWPFLYCLFMAVEEKRCGGLG